MAPKPLNAPRDYAAAILAEPSREGRNRLLQLCPTEWRAQVEQHVRTAFEKIKAYREHKTMRAGLAKEKPPAAPRREDAPNITNHRKSEPNVGNAFLAQLRASVTGAA